jgi:hypothetical protein
MRAFQLDSIPNPCETVVGSWAHEGAVEVGMDGPVRFWIKAALDLCYSENELPDYTDQGTAEGSSDTAGRPPRQDEQVCGISGSSLDAARVAACRYPLRHRGPSFGSLQRRPRLL